MASSDSSWMHVWVTVDAVSVDTCLDEAEAAAMARFTHERDRVRYGTAHSLKRRILAHHYLYEDPLRMQFGRGPNGKPRLLEHPLEFNLSHSEDAFALAVANVPIGVDIQSRVAIADLVGVAQTAFHPAELALWRRLGSSSEMFFRLWTGKEAMVKAEGVGFRVDPREFDSSEGIGKSGMVAGPSRQWRLHHVDFPQFAACVATPSDAGSVVSWFRIASRTSEDTVASERLLRPDCERLPVT
jgi:phosphopantetheinyl transferase